MTAPDQCCINVKKLLSTRRRPHMTPSAAVSAPRDSSNGTLWNVPAGGSLQLDIGDPDHLAPLFGFVGNQLAEIGGRAGKHRAAEIGELRLKVGIRNADVDGRVQFFDDLSRRVFRRADAGPPARLVAR